MIVYTYYDLRERVGRPDINVLFPHWRAGDERIMVLSPHDDDALLGTGYAMMAAMANGAEAHVCIYCDGSAGYSRVQDRDTIIETRRAETLRAYSVLGLSSEHLHRLDLPDFSARGYVGWKLPGGGRGALQYLVPLLRRIGVTRLMIPNGYREHIDHEATFDSGRYDGVQAGDPVLADLGAPCAVRSTLVYAVWGDLSPEDALAHGDDLSIRANRAIVAPYRTEEIIAEGLNAWTSQAQIIEGLLVARRERDCGRGLVELYVDYDPRPKLNYRPYIELIKSLSRQ